MFQTFIKLNKFTFQKLFIIINYYQLPVILLYYKLKNNYNIT